MSKYDRFKSEDREMVLKYNTYISLWFSICNVVLYALYNPLF